MDKLIYWLAGVFILLAFLQAEPRWGGLLLIIVVLGGLNVARQRNLL